MLGGMSIEILTSLQNGIYHITLSRPDKKNALTVAMYTAVTEALASAERDPEAKAVLISGSNRCFSAGNDLGDFLENPPKDPSAPVYRFFAQLAKMTKPLVAAVEGVAVGIGTTLLLHCDLVYADKDAKFILPFVNLGLSPEAGSSHLLVQRVGYVRAAELLLFGEPFMAETAQKYGLINQVVTDKPVLEYALERCARLAAQPAASVRDTKALLKRPQQAAVDAAISTEVEVFIRRLASPEAKEAFAAFAQKRKPDFSRFN